MSPHAEDARGHYSAGLSKRDLPCGVWLRPAAGPDGRNAA